MMAADKLNQHAAKTTREQAPNQSLQEKRRLRQLTTHRPNMFVKNGKLMLGSSGGKLPAINTS